MERLQQALALDLLPRLGVYRLLQRIKDSCPFSLFELNNSELMKLGFNDAQIKIFHHPPLEKLDAAVDWVNSATNRTVISYFDDDYPLLLKEISSPPMLLFCQGNAALLHSPQVAMVGSRAATISGKETAKRLAQDLTLHGFCVTSGLATGIDNYAHQGALSHGGNTIAVLGSGLNVIYPKSNLALARNIEQQGLLVSEFWPNTPPNAPQFPRRNRIVSGLSLGVVVVEAAQRSGSLITARLAAEQNREVFAVPGSINNPKVAGCHALISQGAKLITSVADILNEFPQYSIIEEANSCKHSPTLPSENSAKPDPVLDSIGYEKTPVDTIAQRCNLSIEKVLERLLTLELSGLIISSSGGYIRVKGEV
jgi:DNA processing protein